LIWFQFRLWWIWFGKNLCRSTRFCLQLIVKPVVKLENVLLLYLTRSGSVNSPNRIHTLQFRVHAMCLGLSYHLHSLLLLGYFTFFI
jgi:hypothetical protein